MTDSSFLCRMDSLAFALKAAVKVAGKDELAFVRLHRLNKDTLSISALGNDVSFRAKLKVDFIHWNDDRDDRVEHRLKDPILPGDHEKIFFDAANEPGAPFWITPEAIGTIAGVAKVLHRRIVMLNRSEPAEFASRWYVLGDDWQMTISNKEKLRHTEPVATPPAGDDPEQTALPPRRMLALPV